MRPKKVILLVDGDEGVLSLRTFLLETYGFRVLTAAGPEEALAMLLRGLEVERAACGAHGHGGYVQGRSIELMIAELMLPVMLGDELARRAKELDPRLPVLVVSERVRQYPATMVAEAFLPAGANSPAELLEKVRLLVARKRSRQKGNREAYKAEVAANWAKVRAEEAA